MILENSPKVVRKVISEDTSLKVRDALEKVVSYGTGRNAFIDGYRVGGKTGTAQKVLNGRYMVGNYITSFIGFLPADNPEVVVYIAIDNAKGVTQYGGTIAAPIARQILLDSINALEIERRKDGLEKKYNYFDRKYAVIPNVVGLKPKEAVKELKKFKVEFSGKGEKVIHQSPTPGLNIYEGEIVRLMLN